MAKILFTVCGIGYGHGSRSTILIKELRKRHDVKVISYGDGLYFLSTQFQDVLEMKGFRIFYAGNKIDKIFTFIFNIFYLPFMAISNFLIFRKLIGSFKPDVIITDFDINGLYAAKIFGVPSMLVSNMHMLKYLKTPVNLWEWIEYKFTDEIMIYFFTNPDHSFITSIYTLDRKQDSVEFFGPVVDENIMNAKSAKVKKDYVVVYMSPVNFHIFKPILKKIPEMNFKVYGQKYSRKDGNLDIKEFSREKWVEDLTNCSALICHGGMITLSEAIVLKKPCYVFASKNWFERYHNGIMVKKQGFGTINENPTEEEVRGFIAKIPEYKKKLAKRNMKPANKELIARLEQMINKIKK